MIQPRKIESMEMAFGMIDLEKDLPKYDEIPEEFKTFNKTKWNKIITDFFFSGACNIKFNSKKGIDGMMAFNHVLACLRSFQPKHEHKVAGCAYLMSLWFDDITYDLPKKENKK